MNYPAGTQYDSDAPWNQPDNDRECLYCCASLNDFDEGDFCSGECEELYELEEVGGGG